MNVRSFNYNYHDSQLDGFTLGPRRELTLVITLDPVWNKEAPSPVSVRFGGIKNFDEVTCFFRALPPPRCPESFIGEVNSLKFLGDGRYRVIVDLAGLGQITVQSQNFTES